MSALVLPLAHAGHWINAFLYLSPVLIIGLLLFVQSRRDSGEDDELDELDDREDLDDLGDHGPAGDSGRPDEPR